MRFLARQQMTLRARPLRLHLLLAVLIIATGCDSQSKSSNTHSHNKEPVITAPTDATGRPASPPSEITPSDNLLMCDVSNMTSVCSPAGNDGEGCADIYDSPVLTANERAAVAVRFVVGESGIQIGGGVSLGIHHAAEWPLWSPAARDAPPVKVYSCRDEATIDFTFQNLPHIGMFDDTRPGMDSSAIYHKQYIATAGDKSFEAGDVLIFKLGTDSRKTTVPDSAFNRHQFRITTDIDGDGRFAALHKSPDYKIQPANAHSLSASVPAQVVVGEAFDVLIRLEDEFLNIVANDSVIVRVLDENGTQVSENISIINGIGNGLATISTTGHHRLRLESINNQLSGRSNPLRAFAVMPDRKLYWSDLHGHTSVSDGYGGYADNYFRYARDTGGLDVVALTDHGHFDWQANIKAVKKYHEPGTFVTLLAQEAGAGVDHMNVYYRRDSLDHLSRWNTDYRKFLDHVHDQYNSQDNEAITAPHHFSYNRGNPEYPFGIWDDRVIRMVEVYSSHGTSEYLGNPRPLNTPSPNRSKYMQSALAEGLKFGVIGASDNHDSRPGRSTWGEYVGGLAGIWADDLTRESIWSSLWNYSVYATSVDRIYMDFTINNAVMGETITDEENVTLNAYIIGKTDSLSAAVIRNNETIAEYETETGLIQFTMPDEPESGNNFYYLRVTQDNGERAWSTPIWVEGSL